MPSPFLRSASLQHSPLPRFCFCRSVVIPSAAKNLTPDPRAPREIAAPSTCVCSGQLQLGHLPLPHSSRPSAKGAGLDDPLLLASQSYRPTVLGRHPEERLSRRRISLRFQPAHTDLSVTSAFLCVLRVRSLILGPAPKRSSSPSLAVLPPKPHLAVIQRSAFRDKGSLFDSRPSQTVPSPHKPSAGGAA